MWARVITLCWLLFLIIHSDANDENGEDIPEYEIHDLHDSEISGNKEHLKEHISHLSDDQLENMSDEELEFHFFTSHDYNKDLRLDGLEILSSLVHSFDEEHLVGELPPSHILAAMSDEEKEKLHEKRRQQSMNLMTNLIDNVINGSDKNDDGYLDYVEYMHARQTQKNQRQENQHDHKKKHRHVVKEH